MKKWNWRRGIDVSKIKKKRQRLPRAKHRPNRCLVSLFREEFVEEPPKELLISVFAVLLLITIGG